MCTGAIDLLYLDVHINGIIHQTLLRRVKTKFVIVKHFTFTESIWTNKYLITSFNVQIGRSSLFY